MGTQCQIKNQSFLPAELAALSHLQVADHLLQNTLQLPVLLLQFLQPSSHALPDVPRRHLYPPSRPTTPLPSTQAPHLLAQEVYALAQVRPQVCCILFVPLNAPLELADDVFSVSGFPGGVLEGEEAAGEGGALWGVGKLAGEVCIYILLAVLKFKEELFLLLLLQN